MDGEVLLPERDHLFPQAFLLAKRSCHACRGTEKLALRIATKLMDKDSKASTCVPEPSSGLG